MPDPSPLPAMRSKRIGPYEIRYHGDKIDEIVGPGIHLEYMDNNHVWMALHEPRKKCPTLHVNLYHPKAHIGCMAEDVRCPKPRRKRRTRNV